MTPQTGESHEHIGNRVLITAEKVVLGKETWLTQEIEAVEVAKHETQHFGQWMALDERTLPGVAASGALMLGAFLLISFQTEFPGKSVIIVILFLAAGFFLIRTWVSNLEPDYTLILTLRNGARVKTRRSWRSYNEVNAIEKAINTVLAE